MVCMARMFVGACPRNPDYVGVPELKAALGLSRHPDVDTHRLGAVGFWWAGPIS